MYIYFDNASYVLLGNVKALLSEPTMHLENTGTQYELLSTAIPVSRRELDIVLIDLKD